MGLKYGADGSLVPLVVSHVTENDSASVSTHVAVFAPSGSVDSHWPPLWKHASLQSWPLAP